MWWIFSCCNADTDAVRVHPEVTARILEGARRVDGKLTQIAEWIEQCEASISPTLAERFGPKIATGSAVTPQFDQGKKASASADRNIHTRLARPGKPDRRVVIRSAAPHFDDNGRLRAYIAPPTPPPSAPPAPRATLHVQPRHPHRRLGRRPVRYLPRDTRRTRPPAVPRGR